jgi:hypothetical protein
MENVNKLVIKGKTKVCGIEVPNVYGGFGGDQRVILAKSVAELHDKKTSHVNQLINDNLKHFDKGIDYIDLKDDENATAVLLGSKIFTNQAIKVSKNIYLLSERGYSLLLKFMDSELSIIQYKAVITDYFSIKEIIHTQTLTPDGLKQLVAREIGIIKRNKETEAMSVLKYRGELKHFKNPYACLTNTTYDMLYGMYAKEIKQYLNLREQDNLRDFLSTGDLKEIKEIEEEIVWMVKKNYTWKQIYNDLLKEYPNKIIPIRAEKSIKELKKIDKIAVGESGIKKLK